MIRKLIGAMAVVLIGAFACTEDRSDEQPTDQSAGGSDNENDAPADGGARGGWTPSEAVHAACVEFCELEAVLTRTCVPGRDVVQNGRFIAGGGGAGGAPEETLGSPDCMPQCLDGLRGAPPECEPGYLRALSCATDSVWTCMESPPGSGTTGWSGGDAYPDCSQVYSDLSDCVEQ
jgi:hypothetical protein